GHRRDAGAAGLIAAGRCAAARRLNALAQTHAGNPVVAPATMPIRPEVLKMPSRDSSTSRRESGPAPGDRICIPPAVAAAFPPLWTAVLTRLGSGAALPADEVEPWARAVNLAQLLVQWIDAGLCRCRRSEGAAIGGFVEGAIAPAVLAWIESACAVEPAAEVE
ncbi:MAG TPA: hypothetical protein VFD32_07530, partial [Dehalococcoidia bacterium]|nr:hypothetical protein [Dehalococcoidia bacterium]